MVLNKALQESKNFHKVANSLFESEGDRRVFLEAISAGASIKAGVFVRDVSQASFPNSPGPEWVPDWIRVIEKGFKAGSTQEHERGEIYLLDLSSAFAAVPHFQLQEIRSILDLCAAPGGKGIMAWRHHHPKILIGNEVIGKRTAQLISNYKRCKIEPAYITRADPSFFATKCISLVDLMLVDAPCSGQSLVAKEQAAPGAFHPATIKGNAQRQKRIIANAAQAVVSGGALVYSTCTFSYEENEGVIEWFLKRFSDFEIEEVVSLNDFKSKLIDKPMYRLFPQDGFGAGAFVTLLRRTGDYDSDREDVASRLLSSEASIVWRSG